MLYILGYNQDKLLCGLIVILLLCGLGYSPSAMSYCLDHSLYSLLYDLGYSPFTLMHGHVMVHAHYFMVKL